MGRQTKTHKPINKYFQVVLSAMKKIKHGKEIKRERLREGDILGRVVKKGSHFTFRQNLNNVYYHEDLEEKTLMAEGAESTNS